MKARWGSIFVFLMSLTWLTLLIQGEGGAVSAQTPQAATCNTSFEATHVWGTNGTAPGQFRVPVAIAVDRRDNVHVVDRDNLRVQKFTSQGTYLLEYGNEDARVMINPNGVEVGPNGYMYIADTGQHRILYYDDSGNFIDDWKDGDGSGWRMLNPWGVAGWEDSGTKNVYVVDRNACQILRFHSNGQFIDDWGHCDPASYLPVAPQDVATFINPNPFNIFVYVADTGGNRVMKFDYRLAWQFNWGTPGAGDGQFNQPGSVATDAQGCVYVADTGNHRIQVFDDQGNFVTKFGSQGSGTGQLQSPLGVAVASNGCVYVADTGNNRVVAFCPRPSPEPVDVFIRDNFTDTGIVPTLKPWWESPDIWVRHAPDDQPFPQPPILGQTNYIYVRLRNLGDVALTDVEVNLYCAPPSEAPRWPDTWQYIGSTHTSGMAFRGENTVMVSWNPSGACLPILETSGHLCLLVRLVTNQDPIQNEGGASWDNNIAQLNVHQFEGWTGSANLSAAATTVTEDVIFFIGNPLNTAQTADVEFDRSDYPAGGQLEIYLDGSLFDQWQLAGGTVEGGTVDLAQKKIAITSTLSGVIRSLPLVAGQQISTTMRVIASSDQFFSVQVNELINNEYVGGNLYSTSYASHAKAIELSAATELLSPGSTQTITAAVFGPGKIPIKNGATINFSTTLGTVTPNPATTVNGIATVQLTAGSTTGIAKVRATSGSIASEFLEITISNSVYLPLVIKNSR